MTFNTGTGFTDILTDSGTAVIDSSKPNLTFTSTGAASVSASGSTITFGATAGGGSWVFLAQGTGSTISFNNTYITDTYSVYAITGRRITSNNSRLDVSTDNGSTWKTAVNDYYGNTYSSATAMLVLNEGTNHADNGSFIGYLFDPTNASYKTSWVVDGYRRDTSTGTNSRTSNGACRNNAEDNNAIRFQSLGSNCIINLYGLVES